MAHHVVDYGVAAEWAAVEWGGMERVEEERKGMGEVRKGEGNTRKKE